MDIPYIPRKFDRYLAEWKADENRNPLLVKGARQVGKTESIRHFARQSYENVIEINFVDTPEFKSIIRDGYKPDSIIGQMSLIDPSLRFIPGRTLLFFDEIQEFPDIATSFKFFKQDGRYDVIASGSLLGIHYKRISSVSVGYKTDHTLRSLDFEEFMRARGYGDSFFEDVFSHMRDIQPFNELEHSVLSRRFLDFCVLGGMPRIVGEFLRRGTFEKSLELQREILDGYRDDVRKYVEGMDQTRILNVFDHIAPQLAQENKKFQISKVASGARMKDYRGCIEWLRDAGVVNVCHAMSFPELPIKGRYDESRFKLYMADTGLLVAQLEDEAQKDLRANGNLGVYGGGLYENIVGEALAKLGCELVYYKREDSTLEMDFFVRSRDDLVPVEVKAKGGRSQSLRTLVKSDHYGNIRWGMKLHGGNIGWSNRVLSMPYYVTFLLKRFLSECDPLGRAPARPQSFMTAALRDPWLGDGL
ncbi:MAG: ATP-binding protein [Kiritimatiellae bacterium]|nr:ATP-binding protein [Kiritimatiellia bacterium]